MPRPMNVTVSCGIAPMWMTMWTMVWMTAWATAWATVCAAPCVAAGAPETPRPGEYPRAWLSWIDDSLNGEVGDNRDDFRSNAFVAGCRVRSLLACVDYANLTDKRGLGGRPARVDVLTATLGGVYDRRAESWSAELAAGAGGRRSGDIGGARLQNGWHAALGLPRVELPYERSDDEGVAYLRGEWLGHAALTPLPGEAGIEFSVGAMAGTGGELEGAAGAKSLWLGEDGVAWFGVTLRFAAGDQPSPTARVVADHETGWWLDAGFSLGPCAIGAGVEPRTRSASGSLSALIPLEPMTRHAPVSTVVGEFGATVTAYGLVSQVRWSAAHLERVLGAWMGRRASWVIDYRYGRVPGFAQDDTSLRFRQLGAGLDVAAWPDPLGARDSRWLPRPFAAVLVGWRQERLQHEGPSSAWEEDSAQRAVLCGSLGVRVAMSDGDGGETYGASASIDAWRPLGMATARSSTGGQLDFQRGGVGASLRFVCAAPW